MQAFADTQNRAATGRRTGIGRLPLRAFRNMENFAVEWDLGWRELRPGWTVPQGSVILSARILADAPSRSVTCKGSRGVPEKAPLWPQRVQTV